jgi:hypothetical protein
MYNKMTTQQIIGIVGHIGSGKDTVAEYLESKHGFRRISFAKKVKDVASLVFGWDRVMLEGNTPESRAWREVVDPYWEISPRNALQKIGTEMFRNYIHRDVWVKSVEQEIRNNPTINYVISDCRFENEISMISRLGGKILFIQRFQQNELPPWAILAKYGYELHDPKSGIHITDWNSYAFAKYANDKILNYGSKEDLYDQIESTLFK